MYVSIKVKVLTMQHVNTICLYNTNIVASCSTANFTLLFGLIYCIITPCILNAQYVHV